MDGMQHFDGEIERLVREGVISGAVGLLHATNPGNMRVMMADVSFDEVPRRTAWSQGLISAESQTGRVHRGSATDGAATQLAPLWRCR